MPRLVQLNENEEEIKDLRRARAAALIVPKKKWYQCEKNDQCRRCCKGFLKYVRAYCRITEIHGIRYIVDDRSLSEKIFWLVVWIASCCVAVIMTMDLYSKYIYTPVVISFAMVPTPLYEVPFPVVTICPETRLNPQMLNYTRAFDDLLQGRPVPDYIFKRLGYGYLICNHDPEEPKLYGEMFFDDDVYDQIGLFQLNHSDVFVSCHYRREPFDCGLLTRVVTDQGMCFAFNSVDRHHIFRNSVMNHAFLFDTHDKSMDWALESGFKDPLKSKTRPRRALWAGADHSLEFVLRSSMKDFDGRCNAALSGFRINLNTAVELPNMSKYFLKLSPGMVTNGEISLDMISTRVSKIAQGLHTFSPKVRKCYFVNERYLKFFKVYTQANCEMECISNYTIYYCGCTPFHHPRIRGTKICGIGKYACMEEAEDKVMELEMQGTLGKIRKQPKKKERKKMGRTSICDCLPVCTSLSFNHETTTTQWYWRDNPVYQRLFDTNDTENGTQSGLELSKVQLYWRNDYFFQCERSEIYDITDLIARFGGVINLFIGCSLITGVELIYFMSIKLIANKIRYNSFLGPPATLNR